MTMTSTTCVIVGGGPAGMMAGLVLARAGVEVAVLEKHGDFLRDFRGDTVHPATLGLLGELGLLDRFDAVPHSRIRQVELPTSRGDLVTIADIGGLRLPHPWIAMTPQWDFLNLLADAGGDEPSFHLVMDAEVVDVIRSGDAVAGVRYRDRTGGDEGPIHEIYAPLTIAADGRWSRVRAALDLPVRRFSPDVDLWWFRVDVDAPVEDAILPRSGNGKLFVTIPRRGYLQIGMFIPKGADKALRAKGTEPILRALRDAHPSLRDTPLRLSMDDVKLLDIQLNRLKRWYTDGLLCIGDAAHAMSPVGGVGVNLAVQDGVAAAAMLAGPLRAGTVGTRELARVQRRRTLQTRLVQLVQRVVHRRISPVVAGERRMEVPGIVAPVLRRWSWPARIPARVVLVGLRPEHIPAFARRSPRGSA